MPVKLGYPYDLKLAKNQLNRARRKLTEAEIKSHWRAKVSRVTEVFERQCATIEKEGRVAVGQVPVLLNAVANLESQIETLEDLIHTTKRLETRAPRRT